MATPKVLVLPLSAIEENQQALRTRVDKEDIAYQELKDGIKAVGLLSPISVREYTKEDGTVGYRLVDGLHRKTACADLGYDEMPVNVVTVEDSDLLATQIIGNQHVKTSKTQYAQALKQLIQRKGLTLKEVARTVAKSEPWVATQLGLLDLPEAVRKLVDEDKISVANALSLRKVKDRIEEFLPAAMTESADTFGPRIEEVVKEARAAALQGRKPGAAEFKALPRMRKTVEIKNIHQEVLDTGHSATIQSMMETQNVHNVKGAVKAMLDWFFQLDPVSVAAEKAKWDAEQATKKANADKRAEENRKKKEDAAKKALEELQALNTPAVAA